MIFVVGPGTPVVLLEACLRLNLAMDCEVGGGGLGGPGFLDFFLRTTIKNNDNYNFLYILLRLLLQHRAFL